MVDDYTDYEEDLSFEVELNGEVKGDDIVPSGKGGGAAVNKEDKYHAVLTDVKKEAGKDLDKPKENGPLTAAPSIQLTFDVLMSKHPDQIGKKIYHRLYLWEWKPVTEDKSNEHYGKGKWILKTGKAQRSNLSVCRALCMCETSDIDSGRPVPLNFKGIENRQAIVEIRNDPYEKTMDDGSKKMVDSYKVPYGNAWRPDDEEVKDVQKDPEAMAIYVEWKNANVGDEGGNALAGVLG